MGQFGRTWLPLLVVFSFTLFIFCPIPCLAGKERSHMPQPEDQEDESFKQFMDALSSDEPFNEMDTRKFDSKHVEKQKYSTREYKKQEEVIKKSMNERADPCNNFFEFACGGFLNQRIPPDHSHWSEFTVLYERNEKILKKLIEGLKGKTENKPLKMAYDFYSACMDQIRREELGKEPLLELIKTLGSWPVIDNEWDAENWDLQATLAAINRLGIMPIFSVSIGIDPKNSSSPYRLEISPHQPLLGDVSYYLDEKTKFDKKVRQAYIKLMMEVTAELSPEKRITVHIREEMERVFQYEKELASLIENQEKKEKTSHEKKIYIAPLQEFESAVPQMEWKTYLSYLYKGLKQKPVTDSEIVIIEGLDYLKNASKRVAKADSRVIANYLMWNVVFHLAPALTTKLHKLYMDYYKGVYGIIQEAPLWKRCIRATDNTIDMAVSRLFVDETFSEKSKTVADQTIGYIRNAFIENLQTIDWMDKKTKQAAEAKAKAMFQQVGYPRFIKNDTLLNQYFHGLEISRNNHFQNVLNNRIVRMNNTLKARGQFASKRVWSMNPTAVNAYYENRDNKIVVPAGILQPPFFHESFPSAWRFGAIGFVTGHELTHGFDNNGRRYDKNGNYRNWWSESSVHNFLKRSKCLVEQYSRYPVYNEHVNGLKTLGENIADNGGLKLAHMAYQKWLRKNNGKQRTFQGLDLSPEKLFFVGFAQMWCSKDTKGFALSVLKTDSHSPPKVRVEAALSNSREFAKAFQCLEGSRMNPQKKCVLW